MKRFIGIVLSLFVILSFLSIRSFTPAYAQSYSQSMQSFLPETNPDVPHNMHTVTNGLILDILASGICFLSGSDPLTENHECLSFDQSTHKLGYVKGNGGVLGFMSQLISKTMIIPVHSGPYLHYVASNFHMTGVTQTYAQNSNEKGIGAQGLDPILKIWIGFRNIAYLFIVIIFIVVGLGIMLRIKIDPRTVMSLQNQIPKIIIGLLVITFSYAISGFLIDMTYVLTILFLNIIAQSVGDQSLATAIFSSAHPFGAADLAFKPVGGINGAADSAALVIGAVVNGIVNSNPFMAAINGLLGLVTGILCGIASLFTWSDQCGTFGAAGNITTWLVYFALLVAILVALFRFWISLVNAYISIIFQVILSPLRIVLGGLPGSPGGGFGGFMRDMVANLIIFPVCLSYIFIAGEIAVKIDASSSSAFMMPLVPGTGIGPIIALCALLMLPKIPELTKEALKSKDVFGTAIGQGLAVGAGAAGAGAKKAGARLFQRDLPLQGQSEGIGRKLLMGWTPNNRWRQLAEKAMGETHQAR